MEKDIVFTFNPSEDIFFYHLWAPTKDMKLAPVYVGLFITGCIFSVS